MIYCIILAHFQLSGNQGIKKLFNVARVYVNAPLDTGKALRIIEIFLEASNLTLDLALQ